MEETKVEDSDEEVSDEAKEADAEAGFIAEDQEQ